MHVYRDEITCKSISANTTGYIINHTSERELLLLLLLRAYDVRVVCIYVWSDTRRVIVVVWFNILYTVRVKIFYV